MKAAEKVSFLVLLLGCMAIWVSHAEAREPPAAAPGPVHFAEEEFLFPIRNPWGGGAPWNFFCPDIGKCWSTLLRSPLDCVDSIFESFLRGQLGLSPQCCNAVKEIEEKCFQKPALAFPWISCPAVHGSRGSVPAAAPPPAQK